MVGRTLGGADGRRVPGAGRRAGGAKKIQQVGAFGVVEAQRVGDPVDDAFRDAGGVPAFETDVVLRRDTDKKGGFLASQPGHPTAVIAVGRQAGLFWGDSGSSGAEELPDLSPDAVSGAGVGCGHLVHCRSVRGRLGVPVSGPHDRDCRTALVRWFSG